MTPRVSPNSLCSVLLPLSVALLMRVVVLGQPIPQTEELVVNDPRPLGAAVQLVEQRCHCVVTYEDPRFTSDQVDDISQSLQHRSGRPPALVPTGRPFTFLLGRDIDRQAPDQLVRSIRDVITASEQTNPAGVFQVVQSAGVLHVLPRSGAVLDAVVTTSASSQLLGERINTLLESVAVATGQTFGIGTIPVNLMGTRVSGEAAAAPARDVLARSLQATGRKLSWRLLYDVGFRKYYLNVHPVQ